jgi:glyoxylase-like metal-dependent hydrolase (beta-lactamase superfamily II)
MFQIENLKISKVTDDILLVHQINPPSHFSCCDGLIVLPKKGRNSRSIALDLNIEPYLIDKINEKYGPFKNFVCTHGHMDHIAHVYYWEYLGAKIYAPQPEYEYLKKLENFYRGFGFDQALDYAVVKDFANLNGYSESKEPIPFLPGDVLKFEDFVIETISFSGHSKGHVGLFLPSDKIIHISCLGFDLSKPRSDGFGPWYGFSECSIEQYLEDIEKAKSIFLNHSKYLTSSHSYIVEHPDVTPFSYMRKKIEINQMKVDKALKDYEIESLDELLDLDLFFPKRKMEGFLFEIYKFWELGIIKKHINID